MRVGFGVLIFRLEIEFLIDLVLVVINLVLEFGYGNWVDMGIGSGAIVCGLVDILIDVFIYGIDCSLVVLVIVR